MKEVGKGGFRQWLVKQLPYVHWSCIESHTSVGIPDTHYTYDGVEGFIELKVADKQGNTTIRPSQISWFTRRVGRGGKLQFILIRNDRIDETILIKVDGSNIGMVSPTISWPGAQALAWKLWKGLPNKTELVLCLIGENHE